MLGILASLALTLGQISAAMVLDESDRLALERQHPPAQLWEMPAIPRNGEVRR